MANIQLRGNCQLCGRLHAIISRTGKVAKHGYTVEHGFFSGVCSGSHYVPMQESREATNAAIEAVRSEVAELRVRAGALRAGKIHPPSVKSNRYGAEPIAWEDASEYQRAEAVKSAAWTAERRAEIGERFADQLDALAAQTLGTPLVEVRLDAKPEIEVGSVVTIHGKRVTVCEIKFATARGIGPGVNGKFIEHVYYETESGKRYGYPKRYARLAS